LTTSKKIVTSKQPRTGDDSGNLPKKISDYHLTGKYLIPAVIFLLCMLLYGNTLFNDYAGDDGIYTYQNDFIVKGFSAIKDIFDKGSLYGVSQEAGNPQYRPVPLLNFMIETSIFGFNPHVSHFFNVLFFALTVIVLYFFLQKILRNYNRAIILAATLLFAFHPIHTEVVANIKSRDEILGFLFGLLSFYFIIIYQEQNKTRYYLYSLAAFFMAVFCKENCLTFVVVIPMLLYFFTSLELKKIAIKTIPYIGVVSIYLFIRSVVLTRMTFPGQLPIWENALMAANSNADRIATSFVLLGKYIYMTIVPYPLSCDYSYNQIPIDSWGNIKPILSVLTCAGMIVFMFLGIKKKSIFSFLIAFFFITIFLSSNLVVKIACTFGERFLYVPSFSFCTMLPILTAKALNLNPAQLVWAKKIYFYIAVICVLVTYCIIVIPRNSEWRNNLTIVRACVNTSPNSTLAHDALANMYLDTARNSKTPVRKKLYYSLSRQEFKKAITIYPMFLECYFNLAICSNEMGYPDSAIQEFKKALEINPDYSDALNDLGTIYFSRAQYDTAIHYFSIAYKLDSGNAIALANIGVSYQNEKNYHLAFHYDSLVLKIDPTNSQTLKNLSLIYNDIGMQCVNNNKLDSALKVFTIAIRYDSNSPNPIGNMGVVYQKRGDITKAKYYYQRALSKDPNIDVFKRNMQMLNPVP
jgi:tetratricopeptide (TPR) repeat protein